MRFYFVQLFSYVSSIMKFQMGKSLCWSSSSLYSYTIVSYIFCIKHLSYYRCITDVFFLPVLSAVLNPFVLVSGHNFAIVPRSSMSTPHVAGIYSTTATKHDNHGNPIMAEGFAANTLYPVACLVLGLGLLILLGVGPWARIFYW